MRTHPRLPAITLFLLLSAFSGAAGAAPQLDREDNKPLVAADLVPWASPFADWTVYHIMVEMFANGNRGNDGEINGWKHPNYAGGDLRGSWSMPDISRTSASTPSG